MTGSSNLQLAEDEWLRVRRTSLPSVAIATGSNPVTITGNVTVVGPFTLTNVGAFNAAAASLSVFSDFTISSSYSRFSAPATLTFASISDFTSAHIAPGSVSNNNVTFADQYGTDFELKGNTLNVGGNLKLAKTYNSNFGSVNSGLISVNGNLNVNRWGGGSTDITLTGSSPSFTYAPGNTMPGSLVTYNDAGGTLSLASAVSLNSGEGLTVQAGTINMSGYALSIPATLTINSGDTLTQAGGALIYSVFTNSGTLN